MEENSKNSLGADFNLPASVLDEIQKNIEDIIQNFDIPDSSKLEVIKKINFMYSQTRYMSVTDALTGLYNRRSFEENMEREFLRASRYKSDLSFAIIDIDFFKNINDTYGHACGDHILKEVAYIILQNFRKTDIVFRYGGEEFSVILTETPIGNAVIPLERLRKTIENNIFYYENNKIHLTVSIGAYHLNAETNSALELFNRADKALYKAKENGRNKVVAS